MGNTRATSLGRGKVFVANGIYDEAVTLFRAEDLKKVNAGGGDGTENITVHEIPVSDVRRWLDERRTSGTMIDLKVYSGLAFLPH